MNREKILENSLEWFEIILEIRSDMVSLWSAPSNFWQSNNIPMSHCLSHFYFSLSDELHFLFWRNLTHFSAVKLLKSPQGCLKVARRIFANNHPASIAPPSYKQRTFSQSDQNKRRTSKSKIIEYNRIKNVYGTSKQNIKTMKITGSSRTIILCSIIIFIVIWKEAMAQF